MRKVLKVLSAAMLTAVVAVSAAASVSAAGINAAEQKVLDALDQTATMGGVEKSLPVQYKVQAENYFNTVNLADDQADAIVAKINEAIGLLESSGASNAQELTDAQFNALAAVAKEAASAGDAQITITRTSDGLANIVILEDEIAPTSPKPESGNPPKSVPDSKPITDPNAEKGVIKTTGFDVPSVTAVAGVGILMVSAAGIYLFKTSKKESAE